MSPDSYKVIERRSHSKNFKIFFQFFLADTLNSFLLLLKKNRKYVFDASKYKGLNLGSSTTSPRGWVGISGGITIFFINMPKFILRMAYSFSSRKKRMSFNTFHEQLKNSKVLHHDMFFGIPYPDNSVPLIYSSHFFEHLTHETAKYLLAESFRVMQPGGKIRIIVPSLQSDSEKMKIALQQFDAGNPEPLQVFVTAEYVDLSDQFSYHRYMYCAATLIDAFKSVGFVNAREMIHSEGDFPDLKILELRKGLVAQAEKPL